MKHDQKRGMKVLRRVGITATVLLLALPLLAVGAFAVFYNTMDYTSDESLFEMAKGSRTTRLYYNAAAKEMGDATASDFVSRLGRLSLFDNKKVSVLDGYSAAEMDNCEIHGGADSIWCSLDGMPKNLQNAFIAIEDKRFYTHSGVDWQRTLRAVANYFFGFDGRFGGSTVTQQLIKNISSDNELTAARKLREICRALHLESHHTKEEILELYLNIVPLSQGCVGVAAAARTYYGKTVGELTLAEAASIAAVTNSPARYDPYTSPENNRARRDLILGEMYKQGLIDQASYAAALQEIPSLVPLSKDEQKPYNWYAETVISDIIRDLAEQKGLSREAATGLVLHGGLSVYTAMDFSVQSTLENRFSDFARLPAACQNGMQMAMTVIDPHTGYLLGTVGAVGEKTGNRVLNYATALRAPGSVIKPLSVYAPALEEGLITYATVTDDVPLAFHGTGSAMTAWPKNSPSVYSGLTDLPHAVAHSKNTVAVRIFERLGAERSYAYLANRLGIRSLVRGRYTEDGRKLTDLAPAPLALGQLTDGASLYELTAAYGSLANQGVYCEPRSYVLVLDGRGEVLLENTQNETRVFSEETAYIMTDLLRGVTDFGTASEISLDEQIDLVGKTGTSGEGRDKWFIGYSPYLVCGIWCGYPDGKTPVPTEKKTHLAVWEDVMRVLHSSVLSKGEAITSFTLPRGLVRASYCRDSGYIPCAACRLDPRGNRIATGLFLRGSEPQSLCSCHVLTEYNRKSGGIACKDCPEEELESVGLLDITTRDFPMQIYVTDAQYTLPIKEGLATGHYSGISRIRTRPFNAFCESAHKEQKPAIPWQFGRGIFPFFRKKTY